MCWFLLLLPQIFIDIKVKACIFCSTTGNNKSAEAAPTTTAPMMIPCLH